MLSRFFHDSLEVMKVAFYKIRRVGPDRLTHCTAYTVLKLGVSMNILCGARGKSGMNENVFTEGQLKNDHGLVILV